MEKNKGFDYSEIRNRLMKLKEQAGLDAYQFCEIYAPEKCSSESNAKNYVSALSTGRNYPDEKHGPLLPDIEHLLNIVNSDKFPDATLNYLVYGDETPVKTVEKIDTNPKNWSIADFCIFLGKLMDAQPIIKTEELSETESCIVDGQDLGKTVKYFAVKILEYDGESSLSYDLGDAVHEFVSQYNEMKKISSKTAQEVMYEQIRKAVYSDDRYTKKTLITLDSDSFWHNYESGEEFDGLKLN